MNTASFQKNHTTHTVNISGDDCVPACEAARLLGLKPDTLARYRYEPPESPHFIPYVKAGHRVFYPISELREFMERRGQSLDFDRQDTSDTVPAGAEWLTAHQLQTRWQAGAQLLYEMRNDPRFPNPIRLGRQNRWSVADIEAFEQQLKSDGAAA